MRRIALAAALALAVAIPATAAAGIRITRVDDSSYPTLRVTISGSAATAKPPLLRENGEPVAGATADNLARNANVVLAIDRSQSMRGRALGDAAAAARSFVRSKPRGTRVEIIAFGSRAFALTGMSPATIDSDYALRTLEIDKNQGTAMWDAVVLASRDLGAQTAGGRVLIVLTDGADQASAATEASAIAEARRNGVAVFPIGIESDQFSPEPLQRLAGETGGSYHAARSTGELGSVYAGISRELARTWRIEYATSSRPGDRPTLDASSPSLGADTETVFIPHSLGLGAAPEPPPAIVPKRAYEHGFGTLVLMLAVGISTLGAASLLLTAPRSRRLRRRIDPHMARAAKRGKKEKTRFGASSTIFSATERAFERFSLWKRLQRLLDRADLPLRAVELFYVMAGCAFVPALLLAFGGASSIVLLGTMVIGGAFPVFFVWFKARKRLRQIDDALPDLLITLAASLKAGHSFRQGIQAAADEDQGPITKELRRVLTETSLGRPMDDALNEMAERVGSKDLNFVITAVTIQRQVGGSLAGIFDLVADTIRQRQQFARKIRGLTAMGRASAYVLVGLPFVLAVLLTVINADYMSPLWHTDQGHMLIQVGVGMIAVGAFLLKRIVSFRG